jgi:hypothetical protein
MPKNEPTDKEILDFLEHGEDGVFCWNVDAVDTGRRVNGWTVGTTDAAPQGKTLREAVAWAIKQHAAGKFRTRRERDLDGEDTD